MADKSVWKNIKNIFIVEDEELVKSSKSKSKSTKKPTTTVPSSVDTSPIQESAAGAPGKVTSKFVNVLLAAMEQANLEGFDYLEYKQSLNSLAKMPMDEKTRFQSAYAMAQTMGAQPQKLIDSATHYVNVLKKEEVKFEKALEGQINEKISYTVILDSVHERTPLHIKSFATIVVCLHEPLSPPHLNLFVWIVE